MFCSGKDRADPDRELHTSFELNGDGEFLALVRPDGATIEWTFAPFPPQVAGFSYGLSQNGGFVSLIDQGDPVRALVPSSNLDTAWTTIGYDDSAWSTGTSGVGYDENPTTVPQSAPTSERR